MKQAGADILVHWLVTG